MNTNSYKCLAIDREDPVMRIWLNRPAVRNAFNPQLIAELRNCFNSIQDDNNVRVVLLGGRGDVFCAGADLNWMQDMAGYSKEENYEDALELADMLAALNQCPCPIICRVQKAAMGGALGLMACCDTVICADDCVLAFAETRLGISPATIAPYVVAKIGTSNARDLFLSGQRFSAQHAFNIGLVHQLSAPSDLDEVVANKVSEALLAGPKAARATKKLLLSLADTISSEIREQTAKLIAELRASAEGQEGLAAFLAKRRPEWQEPMGS